MPHPVVEYLVDLHQSLGVGVPETSGYPALRNLLNAVGDSLKPKITAVLHPANSGAGLPDGGLFSTKDLKKHGADSATLFDLKPERGVIEVKGVAQDIAGLEQTPQVRGYLEHYGQILITNYRTFALFSWENGKPKAGERFALAESETDFWSKVHALRQDSVHPNHERLWQFLRRALLSTARIATPQDLAAFLASYAREARARVEIAPMGTLEPIKRALSDALGVHFKGEKGTHFFQSTLVQTLFYGIFSAWVLWHEAQPKAGERFQWKLSAQHLGLPVLRTLFVQLAGDPRKVRALDLEEVLDWTEDCLARVDRTSFFARYDMGEAVQYFYEPFLAAFDPELRRDFGVWYTPVEIVRYMVASVDAALRENFGLTDGLADPSVIVLDPCCGTGAYLVETLRLIWQRFVEGYGAKQAALKIREVAKRRLYGFELLPAPYVVSHLQIDLMLTRWGATLDHQNDERAGVFLTNALTGWVPVKHPKDLPFFEFTAERDAADHVKQKEEILVIIGNPPYDGYAGMAIEEERSLSEAYRTVKVVPPPQGQGLNDLYIRFFRMAERRIAEGVPSTDEATPVPASPGAKGIVCFISNYSWLDGLSHPGMRERFMEVFDSISVDCLNGDKFKTGKRTPEGRPDPSVFSTGKNPEGIKVGTAIALMERRPQRKPKLKSQPTDSTTYVARANLRFRHWWGKEKRAEILASLEKPQKWETLTPTTGLGLPFVPMGMSANYEQWVRLTDLLEHSFPGVQSKQDNLVVDIDRGRLEGRIKDYFDPSISDDQMAKSHPSSMDGTHASNARTTRATLIKRGFLSSYLVRYVYRPFDCRWIYWEPETKLLGRKSPDLFRHVRKGNFFIEARQRQVKADFDRGYVVSALPDNFGNGFSNFFPLFFVPPGNGKSEDDEPDLFGATQPTAPRPNLTELSRTYLDELKCDAVDLFFHIVAILNAPLYRSENSGALRQDWPRVPLPKSAARLREGAALGRQIAALLDTENTVPGVTGLKMRAEFKGLGELTVAPTDRSKQGVGELKVTARWGYTGQGGVVMPGPGRVTTGTRGDGFVDVHLNDIARWKDVPASVWAYTVAGYQVLKKWLSYREGVLLGRDLTSDEAQEFTEHVRRIAAIIAFSPALNRHYEGCRGD